MSDPERFATRSSGLAAELLRAGAAEEPGANGVERTLAALGISSAVTLTSGAAGASTHTAAAAGKAAALKATATGLLAKWVGLGVVSAVGLAGAVSVATNAAAPAPTRPVATQLASKAQIDPLPQVEPTPAAPLAQIEPMPATPAPQSEPMPATPFTQSEPTPAAPLAEIEATPAVPLGRDDPTPAAPLAQIEPMPAAPLPQGEPMPAAPVSSKQPTTKVTALPMTEPGSVVSKTATKVARSSPAASMPFDTKAPLAVEVTLVDRARSMLASGRADEGLAMLERYERAFPDARLLPEALFLHFEACARLNRLAEARGAAQRLVDDFPHSPHAASARKLLGR